MNAQSLAIGRAIERLHALQTFTQTGSARTVALEVESFATAADVARFYQDIMADGLVGVTEAVADWSSMPLTKFDRESLRNHDALDEILFDRTDKMEAYAAENGEQAPGDYSTINVAQLGLTTPLAHV